MGVVKHGYCRTPTYNCWANMIGRCTNKNRPDFKNYGGRGITVCERWLLFVNFLGDMGEVEEGMTIERRNVDGGYSKENCEWVPAAKQNHNKRSTLWVVLSGESVSAKQASERLSVPYERIRWCVSRYGEDWLVYACSAKAGLVQANNKTGFPGVSFTKGRYEVRVQHLGARRHLGSFRTIEEAIDARVRAAAQIGLQLSESSG